MDFSVDVPSGLPKLADFLQHRLKKWLDNYWAELGPRLVELAKEELKATFDDPEGFGFVPLDPEYAASKVSAGLEEGLLRATNALFESLRVVEKPDGIGLGWDATPHQESQRTMAEIAAALEFGIADLNVPARPILAATVARIKLKAKPLASRLMKKHFEAFKKSL